VACPIVDVASRWETVPVSNSSYRGRPVILLSALIPFRRLDKLIIELVPCARNGKSYGLHSCCAKERVGRGKNEYYSFSAVTPPWPKAGSNCARTEATNEGPIIVRICLVWHVRCTRVDAVRWGGSHHPFLNVKRFRMIDDFA